MQTRRLLLHVCACLLVAAMAVGLFSGCRRDGDTQDTQVVKIAGSTSVAPLVKELAAAYERRYPGRTVEIQESGSSAGITAAIEGAADLGMSSRDLKESEKEKLKDSPVALDGIAVIVHPDNPVQALSLDQLQGVFSGKIRNWREVGGADGEIVVVSRESGSGTRSAFEELAGLQQDVEKNGQLLKRSMISKNALFENNTGAVKSDVLSNRNAIGYISLGTLEGDIRALRIDGTPCTAQEITSGNYALARPFLLCADASVSGAAREFLDFALYEAGQEVVAGEGYVSVLQETENGGDGA